MNDDKLTDFESAEFYKKRLATASNRMVVFCVLTFILGVVFARVFFQWELDKLGK